MAEKMCAFLSVNLFPFCLALFTLYIRPALALKYHIKKKKNNNRIKYNCIVCKSKHCMPLPLKNYSVEK